MGQEGEEEVLEDDKARDKPNYEEGGSCASRDVPGGGNLPEARNTRGPDQEQKVRRTFRDQGDNPENPNDWSNFDIGRVVRLFRTNRGRAIRLSLRKLHVRWWHASEHTMRKFLERVGVSQQVLDLIPEIVQTCRICREWQKPGPSNACSIDIADKFNSQVECDLLFVGRHSLPHA